MISQIERSGLEVFPLSPAPRVVAVIPTYNRRDLLLECLESLLRQTMPLSGIVIVDNASTDGTAEAVRRRYPDRPEIVIHRMKENLGSSGGFKAAMEFAESAGYDWLWFTDNDSEPEPESLATLLRAASELSGRGIAAAGLASVKIDVRGNIQASHNGRFTWRNVPLRRNAHRGIVPIEYAAFTGFLVSRSAVAAAGTVDASYFLWGDDVEFCLRIGRTGGRLFLVSDSRILHKDRIATPKERFDIGKFWRYYFGIRNWVRTARVYRGAWTAGPIFFAVLALTARLCVTEDHRLFRAAILLRAFRDGFSGNFSTDISPATWTARIPGASPRQGEGSA